MQYLAKWEDLNENQKELAINQYMAIRSTEEEEDCSRERAEEETPLCVGFWLDDSDSWYINVDI